MRVRTKYLPPLLLSALIMLPGVLPAQDDMAREDTADDAAIIENALSAAPEAIAAEATVTDWEGNVLREGTNDYTCLPDDPEQPGDSPMCLDSAWMAWAQAWMSQEEPPTPEAVSFGYMLQGDFPTSNIDPYAEEETPGNEWIHDAGPHIMVLFPDAAAMEGVSTDPQNGGPWVMWRDTPYEHLMIPTAQKD